MKKMKLFALALFACLLGATFIVQAQQQAQIKIRKNVDGKITEIDSTINLNELQDVNIEELLETIKKEHNIEEGGENVDVEKRIIIKKMESDELPEGTDLNEMIEQVLKEKGIEGNDRKMMFFDLDKNALKDGDWKVLEFNGDGSWRDCNEGNINNFMLRKDGEHFAWTDNDKGYLGVELISEDETTDKGVKIMRVVDESAASEAGLEDGDFITSINGNAVNSIKELLDVMKAYKKGEEVTIEYMRGAEVKRTTATLQGNKIWTWKDIQNLRSPCNTGGNSQKMWIWEDESYTQLGVYTDNTYELGGNGGVLISKIVEGSGANKAGLLKGDIILKVDEVAINENQALTDNIRARKVNDKVTITYKRNGEIKTVDVILQEATRKLRNWNVEDFKELKLIGDPAMEFFKNGDVQIFADSMRIKTFEDLDIDVEKLLDQSMKSEEIEKIQEGVENNKTFKVEKKIRSGKKGNLNVQALTFYPNPNDGRFNIDFNVEEVMNTTVRVMDIAGQIIWEDQLGDFSGQYNKTVDISDEVGNGMYLLQIQRGEQVLTKKVAIQSNK